MVTAVHCVWPFSNGLSEAGYVEDRNVHRISLGRRKRKVHVIAATTTCISIDEQAAEVRRRKFARDS
jgi:hypothetical protein